MGDANEALAGIVDIKHSMNQDVPEPKVLWTFMSSPEKPKTTPQRLI